MLSVKWILLGIIFALPIISIEYAGAQIRIYSSEGVTVIGEAAGDLEKTGIKQNEKNWHRAYVTVEKDGEYQENPYKGKKDVYLFATGYYHPEEGQDRYATGSYKKDLQLNGRGITYTGKQVKVGHVAVDPSVIPLGTEFYSEEHGILKAEDTGGRIKGNRIDIFTGNGENGLTKARKINGWEKLKIVKWGDHKRSSDATLRSPAEHQDPDISPVARFSNYKDYQSLIKKK